MPRKPGRLLHRDVVTVGGEPACRVCGKPADSRLHYLYCSRDCRAHWRMFLARDPSPEEIAAACASIRATWSRDERQQRIAPPLRRQHVNVEGYKLLAARTISSD
jgi:hypothetical protein